MGYNGVSMLYQQEWWLNQVPHRGMTIRACHFKVEKTEWGLNPYPSMPFIDTPNIHFSVKSSNSSNHCPRGVSHGSNLAAEHRCIPSSR